MQYNFCFSKNGFFKLDNQKSKLTVSIKAEWDAFYSCIRVEKKKSINAEYKSIKAEALMKTR